MATNSGQFKKGMAPWNKGLSSLPSCPDCNKTLKTYGAKFCGSCVQKGERNHMFNRRGQKHPNWRGGKSKHSGGYTLLNVDKKYILEHRYLIEKYLGRKLEDFENIHHKNRDRSDNRLINLQLLSDKEHGKLHSTDNYEMSRRGILGAKARWEFL